jgi:predicted DNA-binding protein (MmcQ/YjbR family)
MHRFHWVTVVRVAAMDTTYLRELVVWSHQRALSALPKKVQRAIAEAAAS